MCLVIFLFIFVSSFLILCTEGKKERKRKEGRKRGRERGRKEGKQEKKIKERRPLALASKNPTHVFSELFKKKKKNFFRNHWSWESQIFLYIFFCLKKKKHFESFSQLCNRINLSLTLLISMSYFQYFPILPGEVSKSSFEWRVEPSSGVLWPAAGWTSRKALLAY